MEEEETERLIKKLQQLISLCRGTFTEKDNLIFKKMKTIEDKKNNCADQLTEIDSGRRKIFTCIDKVDRKVTEMSGGFFETFHEAFLKMYKMFEKSFKVDCSLQKLETQPNETQKYSIEFELIPVQEQASNENLFTFKGNFSRKQLSKGKKAIFVLCVLLAFDSIEQVCLLGSLLFA